MTNWKILPPEFLERLKGIIPPLMLFPALNSFSEEKNTTFRVNSLKAKPLEIQKILQKKGIKFGFVPWYKNAFVAKNTTLNKLQKLDIYKNGEIYIQSLSSMIPPLVLDPKPGEKVLDITAAPGSKTTQIASLMQNQGEIVANDISPIRIQRLKKNLETQGVKIARISEIDARNVWRKYGEYFDKVLVDVACSMEGRINVKNHKSFRNWSVKIIKKMQKMQKWILRSAVSCLKVGGSFVYSTCTLAPEENEEVIDWILKKEKGNIVIKKIEIQKLATISALSKWQGKEFDREVKKTLRILPSKTMEGFYIALLQKIKTNVAPNNSKHKNIKQETN